MVEVKRYRRRRFRQLPVPGGVPLYHECEIPRDGKNEHGIEFETTTWSELWRRYGRTAHRRRLLQSLFEVLAQYRDAGVRVKEIGVYGSFVSDKAESSDIDVAVWREPGGEVTFKMAWDAGTRGVDLFSVTSYKHYCNWLAHKRERGSTKVIRVPIG